jgi:hypothetical protein
MALGQHFITHRLLCYHKARPVAYEPFAIVFQLFLYNLCLSQLISGAKILDLFSTSS